MLWGKLSPHAFLTAFLIFSFSSPSDAAPEPPEDDCSGTAMPAYSVSVPSSDPDGNYTLTFSVPPIGWDYLCSDVAVQESKDGGSYSSIGGFGGSSGPNTVSITGRDSGTYKYRVKHYMLGGGTATWVESNQIVVAIKPKIPGSISFSYNEGGIDRNGSFKVNWGASSTPPKITGYQIWQCKGSCSSTSGSWSQIYSAANTSTRSITVPSSGKLTNGSYMYRVRSFVTVSTTTKYSDWRYSSSIAVNRYPDEVKNFTQPGSGTQTENFQVAWSAVEGAFDAVTRYELQCSIDGGTFSYSTCGNSDLQTATSMPIELPEGTEGEYKFRARGCNAQGCGPWTTAPYQKTVAVKIPLPKPTNVSIQLPKSSDYGDYDVTWSATGTVTSWELKRECKAGAAPCGQSSWHDIQLSSPLATSYPVGGATADEHRYQVRACNGSSCSNWVVSTNWIKVHNLENIAPAVSLAAASTPGKMNYNADVSQQGDALISIPVQAAPGVNGLEPSVGIQYSGARYRQRNNEALPEDIMGNGWRLAGFGEIRRCVINRPNSESIQLDNTDSLCLNGEPLVLVSGSYWATGSRYRTLRERFHLIELATTTEGKKWFKVSTPDGSVQEYGNTVESRLKVGTSTEFGWSLNKVTDAFGNSMEYSYHLDTVEGINYPLGITYGNGGDARIEFAYGTRTDAPPQPLLSGQIQQEQLVLLHHINVYRDWNGSDGKLLREYRLITEEEPADPEEEHYRRLQYIQLCAYAESGLSSECLNPLQFGWLEPAGGNPDVEFKTGIGEITDSLGKITQFHHTMIRDGSNDGQFFEQPFGQGILPADTSQLEAVNGKYRCVVGEVHRSNGLANDWHITSYAYQGTGLVSDKHWGFLGYYAQRVHDEESGIVTYRQFRLDFPHFGQVARLQQYQGEYPIHNQVLTTQQFRYGDIPLSTGADTSHYPVLQESLETLYEQGEALGYRLNLNNYNTGSSGYGQLIDGVVRTQKTATGATAPSTQSYWGEVAAASVSGVQRSAETTTSYSNRTSGKWLIGFAAGEEVRHYNGNTNLTADRVQTLVAIPHATSNKPDTVTRFPGDPIYQLAVGYTYDGSGNLLTETTSGAGIETRVASASGYVDKRYPGTLTNALSQPVSITYDPRFGAAKTVTDANNRTTAINYDPFGRELTRTNPDLITFSTQYEFCSGGSCPVYGNSLVAYRVSTSSSITPATDRYYDLLGRLIQQDTESFDGSTVSRREFNYDLQGRLYLETAPFFANDYKPLTIYEYDLRNRVKKVNKPDGSAVRTIYEALTATNQVKVRIEEDVLNDAGLLQQTQVKENFYKLTGDLAKTVDAVGTAEEVATGYTYDGSGLVQTVKVDNNLATESSFLYDNAGYRFSLTDPNLGTVITAYDALGQIAGQTDNKGQTISYLYDKLGRLFQQTDPDGVAEWDYDPANAIGELASRSYTQGGSQIFHESYGYLSNGKLQTTTTNLIAGGLSRNYQHGYGYDGSGRLERVTYPSGIAAHYQYNGQGYLSQITDGSNPLKTFDSVNALGQAVAEVYGNNVVTNRTYNAASGRLESIETGNGSIQNNEYHWRSNGTLESRLTWSGGSVNKEEAFGYDALNRLNTAETWLSGSSQRTLTTLYNKLGNITEKTSSHPGDSNVSGYQYGEFGNAGPNAVSNVTVNGASYTLNYDQNGAITHYDAASGDDKWISWNARQLPTEITLGSSQGTATPAARDRFQYGPNGQRFYRESSWWDEGAQALQTEKAFIVGSFEDQLPANDPDYQRIQKASIDSNIVHISATDHASITVNTLEYLHRDHLGSIEKITDETGNTLLNTDTAFEPYGQRKKADWSGELSSQELEALLATQGLTTKRGFTGHEHLDRTGLIHMNGRIYDPTLGRFLSPDPFVQYPNSTQSWNRYSYVRNNPLSVTDPSGYMEHVYVEGYWPASSGWGDMGSFFWESGYGSGGWYDRNFGAGRCSYFDPYCEDDNVVTVDPQEKIEEVVVCGGGSFNAEGKCVADKNDRNSIPWFTGDGKDDSDIRWSAGLQGGVKLGVKGIFGAAIGVKVPVIETSLVTGDRYASEEYALVVDIGKLSFGYEVKRSISVGQYDVMAGKLLQGMPFDGGFKFGAYGVNSSEFGVFSIGLTAIGSIGATFDFADGVD